MPNLGSVATMKNFDYIMKFTAQVDFRIFLTRKFFWSLKQREVID